MNLKHLCSRSQMLVVKECINKRATVAISFTGRSSIKSIGIIVFNPLTKLPC